MKVLIADDDSVPRRILEVFLRQWGHDVIVTADGLAAWAAIDQCAAPLLAIVDWVMPGIDGAEICRRIQQSENKSSIYTILLTSKSGKNEIVEGLESGADDYLIKPFDPNELKARIRAGARVLELQNNLLARVRELEETIVERDRAESALRILALTDELTGLYNRRGFYTFVEHYLSMARRTHQQALLYYFDMDGLKLINDTLGHAEGSLAIKQVAYLLRQTFRQSDIIARIGGDEFVCLATNAAVDEKETMLKRFRENFDGYNLKSGKDYRLAASCGVVDVNPQQIFSLEELIIEADQLMYQQKREKKGLVPPPAFLAEATR